MGLYKALIPKDLLYSELHFWFNVDEQNRTRCGLTSYAARLLTDLFRIDWTVKEGNRIEGDRKGGGRKRHLNVMSAKTLADLAAHGFATRPGEMGEQLVIADLDVDRLPVQSRVRLGPDAVIEMYEARTGCNKFERVQDSTCEEVAGQLGMMARVLTGGKIKV